MDIKTQIRKALPGQSRERLLKRKDTGRIIPHFSISESSASTAGR